MPTVITHAIAAGALSKLAPADLPRVRLAIALAALAVIPDLDVIGFRFGIAYGDSLGHRGFTHSIPFAAIAALVTPSIAFREIELLSRSWWLVVAFAFVATASHGVLDAFTDDGLGVGFTIPFDDTRYFAPWRPLKASPLTFSKFLDSRMILILSDEFVYVGVPLVGLFGVRYLIRRLRGDHRS